MNKILILTAAQLCFSFAFAQQPERKGPPPPAWRNAQERKQSMLDELHLSDSQKEQLKKEASAQMMERREKLRSLMEEQSKNLKQILNEEQLEKYKIIIRDRMQKMRQENPMRNRLQNNAPEKRGRPNGPDGPPPPPKPRKTDSTESI